MANTVALEFVGEGDKLISESKKVSNAVDDVDRKTKKSSSSMISSWKGAAAGIAAVGIATQIKAMFNEAKEAEQVSRSTAQGIKTMGAEAWTSAEAIGALAESISNKIGVDDEAIQSSANLLLTFGNVKNAVGNMNNIFDRAVLAAQDLAAKGFGSADAGAKMLGKALNDPIKGMTALGKAGVTFTQSQKDQIKAMVESGDLLGAQKLLLAEVEKQVGGTAAATATSTDKMAVRWANFQEQLGTTLMPVLEKVLGLLGDFLSWASEHEGIVIALAAITAGIWLLNAALNANPIILVITIIAALVAAFIWLWNTSEGFRNFWKGVWKVIGNIVQGAVDIVKGIWRALVDFFTKTTLGKIIVNIFKGIGNVIGGVVDVIKWLIDRIADAIGWAIDLYNQVMRAAGAGQSKLGPKPAMREKKHHTGGIVAGMPGTEVSIRAMAGEKVGLKDQGGGTTVTFAGDTNSAFATAFMKLIRDGDVIIGGQNS